MKISVIAWRILFQSVALDGQEINVTTKGILVFRREMGYEFELWTAFL